MRTRSTREILRCAIALSFFAVAAWALKPDKLDDARCRRRRGCGVFAVTTVAFFLAEMGDKTQIATAVLAARFDALVAVVAGTTLGMLLVDVPAVFAGKLAADRIPFGALRQRRRGHLRRGRWVLWRACDRIAGATPVRVGGRYNRAPATIQRASRASPLTT